MEQWKRGTKERSRRYVSEAYVQTLAAAAGISMITAFLFYRSVWGMCTFFVFAPLCLKFRQKREAARREVQIQKEFLTAMESVSGALMAGYSLESAWKYAQQETEQMYGIHGIFSRELRQLNQKLFMHERWSSCYTNWQSDVTTKKFIILQKFYCMQSEAEEI